MVVTYRTDTGNLRVLQRTSQLPLKMMLTACAPENATTFTTILKRNEPLVGLTQLFPGKAVENPGDLSSCPPNSFASFCRPAEITKIAYENYGERPGNCAIGRIGRFRLVRGVHLSPDTTLILQKRGRPARCGVASSSFFGRWMRSRGASDRFVAV